MDWRVENENFIFSNKEGDSNMDNIAILHNLTDNNIGNYENNTFVIPALGIYELTDGQRRLLDLPEQYSHFLRIDSSDNINSPRFQYKPIFSPSKEFGKYIIVESNLPIVKLASANGIHNEYLLPICQYKILKEIRAFEQHSIEEDNSGYRSLSRIKAIAAADEKIVLNDYLKTYDVVSVDNIKLTIDYTENVLEIKPELPSEILNGNNIRPEAFTERFDKRNRALPVYTINEDNGKEHKILVPTNSIDKLTELKAKFRKVSDTEEIHKIIEHPEQFLDEDLFDLREFYSDRVIEIGLYKPKFEQFVCPYKSEWIPGFRIVDRYNGNTNIILKKSEEIQRLQNAIQECMAQGQSSIQYMGYDIDLETAMQILEFAKLQNENPSTKNTSDKKILIIEENAESLGYKEDDIDIETPKEYILHEIHNLKEEITLKQHQNTGVAWLQYLMKTKSKGCILADDMGLGKTLQILCFIDWHNKYINRGAKPYIIVSPVSLLDNWNNEIKKFLKAGTFNPIVLHGSNIDSRPNNACIEWLKKQDLILTNYETVRRCQFNICAVDYAVVVLDEAQKVKTPGTYITCAAKALKADFRIAMTGTPVENTFLDLWCIMDFAIPGLLGNAKEFKRLYQDPLKDSNTDTSLLGKELRERMGVFFLRRRKIEVLKELPEKIDVKREVLMSAYQEKYYIDTISSFQEIGLDGGLMLKLISKLRRISDTPLIDMPDLDIERLSIDNLIDSSGKIQATVEILDDIQTKQEKAIVFCIFKESQRILQRIIHDRYGFIPKIINGDTKVVSNRTSTNGNYSRQQAIDSFESVNGFNVIIMSPIAAGMGLNVTAANHVIHFGRHWNPAKESQATDRAYRIGQDKTVYVHYPITTLSEEYDFDSFEQTLDLLLCRKSDLADATLFPTAQAEVRISDFNEFVTEMQRCNVKM